MTTRQLKMFILLLCQSYFGSCNFSDRIDELSGGYFLRMEAKSMNEILSHTAGGKEIPSNVLTYNYNSNFIIATQKPSDIDDPLYSKVNYKEGRDKVYYWLIVHSKKITLGPMSKSEFEGKCKLYNVPQTLDLKPLDWR